ncbi:hypothetical protein PCK1_002610 [Pneumocystis canis]|nr:hypothetical protein PCK1_002610 [Pneumocystis canis]
MHLIDEDESMDGLTDNSSEKNGIYREKSPNNTKESKKNQLNGCKTYGENVFIKKNEKKTQKSAILESKINNKCKTTDTSISSLEKQQSLETNFLDKENKKTKKQALKWEIKNVAGGYFSDIAPIFTKDEKKILIAFGSVVKVYNIQTGICIQTIGDLDQKDNLYLPKITGMALDPLNEYRIYLSDEEGAIKLWDWMGNNMLRSRYTRRKICYIALSQSTPSSVYAVLENDLSNLHNSFEKKKFKKNYEIYSYIFPSFELKSTKVKRSQRIVKCKTCIGMNISPDGKTLVVGSIDFIYVCKKKVSNSQDSQNLWETRKFDVDGPINTLIICNDHVAVGDYEGKLLIYYNILKLEEPIVRIFHWHPQPFSAINWTLEESYILTGGKEGVLVFWQIATGNKQFLPRLGSPIKKISVSRTNSLYSILLEDNSIKIINAIDLKAKCEIFGVQIGGEISYQTPSVFNPITKNILFASQSLFSSTFLQSYDIIKDCQTYKIEVIRRFHIETLEKDNIVISKPRITHISLSADSLWMATIDEWELLNRNSDSYKENREIFLKFWKWNSLNKKWDLTTRIDFPHGFGKKVNGLNACPNEKKFSTIGDDGSLKIWKLKIKNENKTVKTEIWVCYKVIRYTRISYDPLSKNEIFCITWTLDGSMIVVGCNNSLLIVNERLGIICHTVNNLCMGKILFVQALGAFIIIITKKHILVWDILRASTKWCLNIPKIHKSLKDFYLAADHTNHLFAVSFNNSKKNNSKLYIFKIKSPIPIFLQQHPYKIIMLNHMPSISSSSSFTFMDTSGRFFTLTKDVTFIKNIEDDQTLIEENTFKLSDIYGTISSNEKTIKSLPEDDMRSKTVSIEALSLLFDIPAYTMPSLTLLLEETMKLIGEPPLERFSKTLDFETEKT